MALRQAVRFHRPSPKQVPKETHGAARLMPFLKPPARARFSCPLHTAQQNHRPTTHQLPFAASRSPARMVQSPA